MRQEMETQFASTAPREQATGDRSDLRLERFRVADWTVDPSANRLNRGGETVKLEPKVIDLLVFLAEHPGKVVTRDELHAAVWAGTVVGYDTLTGAIQKLRRAFREDSKQPRVIETIPKKGYRLVAPVTLLAEPSEELSVEGVSAAPAPSRNWLSRKAPAASVVIALILAGALFWISPWQANDKRIALETSPRSVAVLPFDYLSDDSAQEYLADGITDDLITGLAKNPDLLVIARDSTFVYKDQPQDVRQVAEALNARFIVDGSVRRIADSVRINAQLIDASSGSHLWAERYAGQTKDILALQDKITRKIVAVLSVKVGTGQRQDLGLPHTDNPQAYDSFLLGRQSFYLYLNKDENQKARAFFQRAIEHDPQFAMAYAMLAWTHSFDAMNGWSKVRESSLQRAQEFATKAITLQEAIPVAYFVRGLVHRERGEYVKALVEAEKAIDLDPNYANAHVLLATILYYAGRPQEGLKRIKKAIRINPHHPYNYTFHLGQAYFILGLYNEAIEAFQRGIESNPASERLHVWLAAAYAQAGEIDEAEWETDQVLTLNPEFSLQNVQNAFPFKEPTDLKHFLDGLRRAGF